MVFNATFNNISTTSWRAVLLVEETGLSRENHRTYTVTADNGNPLIRLNDATHACDCYQKIKIKRSKNARVFTSANFFHKKNPALLSYGS
jgi:hypothetical protein